MKMKSAIFAWMTLMLLNGCGLITPGQKKSVSESQKERPVVHVPLADPFILLHDGTYYAYGTKAEHGIAVFESDDLQTWRQASGRAAVFSSVRAWPCIRTTYTETAGFGLRRFTVSTERFICFSPRNRMSASRCPIRLWVRLCRRRRNR
jgi:hypothetical protein